MKKITTLLQLLLTLTVIQTVGYGQVNTVIDTRLGIGRTPSAKLDINSASGEDALRVRVNGGTILRVLANKGTTIGSNPGNAPANGLYVSGNTGLGTTTATEKLQINGALRLAGDASSEAPSAGTVRWNPNNSDFEGYDGTNWKSLTGTPSTNQTTYQIGDRAQGGIVFWVTPDGMHGKVIHLHLMQNSAGALISNWSNIVDMISGARSITQGELNTLDIINQQGHINSPAKQCFDLNADGYNDWYLPAADEIALSRPNISVINDELVSWGGSPFFTTWTSTEQNQNAAIWYDGTNGNSISKSTLKNFRAIRSF